SSCFLITQTTPTKNYTLSLHDALPILKGKSNSKGTTRKEWEYNIPIEQAREMLDICERGSIEKYRYLAPIGKHIFEIDVFEGDNQGLIVAEIELSSENEVFQRPSWLGKEVTGNSSYYNSQLSLLPYNRW